MTNEPFDQNSWERRWAQALHESPEKVASRPPNALLLAEIGDMQPGFALDAGCGHGSEAIWLAASGWQVTAVDFSATALDFGRSTAHAAGLRGLAGGPVGRLTAPDRCGVAPPCGAVRHCSLARGGAESDREMWLAAR
jgi:SAM-dependent methyltransferase